MGRGGRRGKGLGDETAGSGVANHRGFAASSLKVIDPSNCAGDGVAQAWYALAPKESCSVTREDEGV